MTKKLIFTAILATIATIAVLTAKSTQNAKESELLMASIEAVAQSEPGKNFGPAKIEKCANKTQHMKLCMCQPGYPECTETPCFLQERNL